VLLIEKEQKEQENGKEKELTKESVDCEIQFF
jgi:hypothetical protein